MELNMKDNKDNRNYFRMKSTGPAKVRIDDECDSTFLIDIIDVSASGLLFECFSELLLGTKLTVWMEPFDLPFPSLKLSGKVVRCDIQENNKYSIAIQATI
jgi:hypothetical protein